MNRLVRLDVSPANLPRQHRSHRQVRGGTSELSRLATRWERAMSYLQRPLPVGNGISLCRVQPHERLGGERKACHLLGKPRHPSYSNSTREKGQIERILTARMKFIVSSCRARGRERPCTALQSAPIAATLGQRTSLGPSGDFDMDTLGTDTVGPQQVRPPATTRTIRCHRRGGCSLANGEKRTLPRTTRAALPHWAARAASAEN